MTKGAFRGFQVFVFCVVACCIALGTWQIKRHFWKADLLETAAQTAAQPPIDLPRDVTNIEPYRRVSIRGRFLENRDIPILGHAVEGISGTRMYAPFQLDDGRVLLIQRGWVPRGSENKLARTTNEALELEVAWRPIRERRGGPSFTQLQNAPEIGLWSYLDTSQLEAFWPGTDLIDDAYGELRSPEAAAQGARIEPFRADLFNRHLEYVATWWSLAAGMLGIYILVWLDRRRKKT